MSGGGRGIDPRFMQELKQKNNIVEVIGSYVALDRKGGNYWACCPFHHEKTPSFAVNEADQFYHCFGCGVSGDVVMFVQEIESTDFMGAVRILAARAKIPVPESNFDSEKTIALKKAGQHDRDFVGQRAVLSFQSLRRQRGRASRLYFPSQACADDGQKVRTRRFPRFLLPPRLSRGQGVHSGKSYRQRRARRG